MSEFDLGPENRNEFPMHLPSDFNTLIEQSRNHLALLTQTHQNTWGFGTEAQWIWIRTREFCASRLPTA